MTIAGLLVAVPAFADKPSWAGGGKHDRDERSDRYRDRDDDRDHNRERHSERRPSRFVDRDRIAIREYYVSEYHRGNCPPGLAKKHNGCMPPGQVKKWPVGAPLPHNVAYYELPPVLVVKLGVPPPGYQYVRVASDILLISVGTRMVVDAIRDLGRL
jgi:Ni/Co efflux regulator RcnB